MQASRELRIYAAIRKWPLVTLWDSPLSYSRGTSGKLYPCLPLQGRHAYWACWALSLGGGTYCWIEYSFKDGHLVSVPQFQQPAQRKWVLRIGFRFATVALQLWYTLATIRGRLSEREGGREKERKQRSTAVLSNRSICNKSVASSCCCSLLLSKRCLCFSGKKMLVRQGVQNCQWMRRA